MKVLHVGTKTWPPRHGGVEKIVHDLATATEGVENWVLADECAAPFPRTGALRPGLLGSFRQVVELVRGQGIDLVHAHKETSIPLALLLRAAGIPVVLTLHGLAWRLERWSMPARAVLWLLDLAACLTLPAVVFVGRRDYEAYHRRLPCRLRAKRLWLVPNGVEVPPAPGEAASGEGWVYLGRISPEKNVVALMEAAQRRGLLLDLHGPLDERDAAFASRFRELAGEPGLRWHGPLDYLDVPARLAAHRVLVNPSFSEGLPVSVLEGAAQGLFLVLSDIPQHRLLDFPDCTYVDPRHLELAGIPERPEGGEANRRHARAAYSLESMRRGYLDVYRTVAGLTVRSLPR